jgi:molecular chaperone IbpA
MMRNEILFNTLPKFSIGFDSLYDQLHMFQDKQVDSYPPHNIIKEDENKFCVEMALAGFKKDEIKVTWQEDLLTIEGDRGKRNDNENYVYKSIGHRTFKKIFSLSELVEVTKAGFEDGVLHVHLEKNIPEEKKPKVISIT